MNYDIHEIINFVLNNNNNELILSTLKITIEVISFKYRNR